MAVHARHMQELTQEIVLSMRALMQAWALLEPLVHKTAIDDALVREAETFDSGETPFPPL